MSPHASSSRRPKRSATAPNTGAKNRRRSQHGHDQPQFGVADPEWLRERGQGGLNEIDAHDEGDACGENEGERAATFWDQSHRDRRMKSGKRAHSPQSKSVQFASQQTKLASTIGKIRLHPVRAGLRLQNLRKCGHDSVWLVVADDDSVIWIAQKAEQVLEERR